MKIPTSFEYSPWRHGGWYVGNVRYPSGACGCVSNNYTDKKWRIACDSRPFEQQPTFPNRDAAALGEWLLINQSRIEAADDMLAALKRCIAQLSEKRPKPSKSGGRRPFDFNLEMAIAEAGKAIAKAEAPLAVAAETPTN